MKPQTHCKPLRSAISSAQPAKADLCDSMRVLTSDAGRFYLGLLMGMRW
jgi:hypothetical protein